MKALYKRIDHETSAWDLNVGCRRFTINNKNRRDLRRKLRRMARKKINSFMTNEVKSSLIFVAGILNT